MEDLRSRFWLLWIDRRKRISFVFSCRQCPRGAVEILRRLKKFRMRFRFLPVGCARQVAIEHGDGNDAAPWHLLAGPEHADAASVMAATDVAGRTTRQKLSGLH